LADWLRDEHGGGEFAVFFRRGETVVLSGAIAIGVPLNHPNPFRG
jgi:hypothetical protein